MGEESDDLDDLFEPRTLPPRPDFASPSASPTGTAGQRAEFFLKNTDVSPETLRTWWATLTAADQAGVQEHFKKTPEYIRAQAVCDHWFAKGRAPLVMLIWAKRVAGELGFVK